MPCRFSCQRAHPSEGGLSCCCFCRQGLMDHACWMLMPPLEQMRARRRAMPMSHAMPLPRQPHAVTPALFLAIRHAKCQKAACKMDYEEEERMRRLPES